MTIHQLGTLPVTACVLVSTFLTFQGALEVVAGFAESPEVSGGHFSRWDVKRLRTAARLITEKLDKLDKLDKLEGGP
jgi:hypothetical protein